MTEEIKEELSEAEIKEVPEWMKDGLELKYVLSAISDFIKEIREPLRELVDTIMKTLSGEKLGEEVASFYRNLIDSGIPEDMAKDMTKKYFETRIGIFDMLKNAVSNIDALKRIKEKETINVNDEEKESEPKG